MSLVITSRNMKAIKKEGKLIKTILVVTLPTQIKQFLIILNTIVSCGFLNYILVVHRYSRTLFINAEY